MSLFLSSLSASGAAGAVRAVAPLEPPLERGAQAAAGIGAAVESLRETAGDARADDARTDDAWAEDARADDAWARIDLLLHQMRQLTLGGADSAAAASATTTVGAISAYSEHSSGDKGA
ncbi:MAG TPA: hypothetical protein VIG55_13860 [Methylosinus sp.]